MKIQMMKIAMYVLEKAVVLSYFEKRMRIADLGRNYCVNHCFSIYGSRPKFGVRSYCETVAKQVHESPYY